MATIVSDARWASDAARWSLGPGAELADGLRAGRRDAFEQLYELYRARIYNLTLRIVQSPEDARDITQDVFIKAFRKLPGSSVGEAHLTPWLCRVAVNASYDHLRTRRQHGDIDDLSAHAPAVPIDTFEQAEMGRRVEQTLAGLSERHRAALVLKDIHGLRHDEMAEILGVSPGATETLLFRAREAFRARYLELAQGQPGSNKAEKWSAAGIGIGTFLHEIPLPPALQGGFPFGAAGAGAGAGAGAAAGASAGAGAAAGGASAGAAAASGGAAAAGSSTGFSLAAGGLLAKVGGAATAKLAAVAIAATCAAGGGAAAYEAGVLPGVPHHPAPIPPAQAQQHPGGHDSEKVASAGSRGNSAGLNGAEKSAAARERAAGKRAAKAAKNHGKAAGKKSAQDRSKVKANGKTAGKTNGKAKNGGGSSESINARNGNAGGDTGVNGRGSSNKPDRPDKPDKPDKTS